MSSQELKTITVLPLQIQWQGQQPIYHIFSADTLRSEMNMYFKKKKRNIRIRQISYEEVQGSKQQFYDQNNNFVNYEDYEIENQQYNSYNTKDYKQIDNLNQQIKSSNLFFENIKAFANIYLYSNPNIYLASSTSLRNRCPRSQSKIIVKAWIEIPRQDYDSYHNFCFRLEKNHDNILLLHPSEHIEYQKVRSRKKSMINWTISFEPSSQIISHFIDFKVIASVVSKIRSCIDIKTFILHQNSEQFQIISQIFNGIVFKFTIKNTNVKYCRLIQQNNIDTFYFSLIQQPLVYAVIQDYKTSKDIQYQRKWIPFHSFLNCSRSYSFRNHFVFDEYFLNSNVISIQTEKLSQTSMFFRGFCYKIKQRFHILVKPMKQISIHKIINQLKDNQYQQMVGNMFISPNIKSQLVFILRELMVSGQLSMIDILDLFTIKTFALNVEIYLSVLQMMIMNGGEGIQWVKTMYNSLMNIGSQQSRNSDLTSMNLGYE